MKRKPKKEKREKRPEFKTMVDHIDLTWRKAKKSDTGYPFHGRDFKDLKHFVGYYQEWGMMALWDIWIETATPWAKSTGLSLGAFFKSLPGLVDRKDWKIRAAAHEAKMMPPMEEKVMELFVNWKIEEKKYAI